MVTGKISHWIFHCIEIFFIFQEFRATYACPENKVCPENFHCIEHIFYHSQDFWASLRLPWKTECALNLYWIYSFIIQNFEQLALALKNRVCPENFHCIKIFFIFQDIWAACAYPENKVCLEIFHGIEYTFYIHDFWATCACPEKTSVPWIHCITYIFFIIQNFEQLVPALKNRVCLEFFTVLNILFAFRIFERLALALKNRLCPGFQSRSHRGAFGGSAPPIFFVPPQMIQWFPTRKINQFCKCLFSICLIVTPTRNITARCVKR